MKDIFTLTKEARSVRVFNGERNITEDELCRIVDCARIAPSAGNLQVLRYKLCFDRETVSSLMPMTRWAGYLPEAKLPPAGHEPTAFIVICNDGRKSSVGAFTNVDVGIAAQSINLAAREVGLAVCMIGSFDRVGVKDLLKLDENCEILLMMAIGEPAESPVITELPDDGSIKYYRDSNGGHFVPKRPLEEILIR